jgi:hypothetical protein
MVSAIMSMIIMAFLEMETEKCELKIKLRTSSPQEEYFENYLSANLFYDIRKIIQHP